MFEPGKESRSTSDEKEYSFRPRSSTISMFTRPSNTVIICKVEPKLPSLLQPIAILADLTLVCGDKSLGFEAIQECKHIVLASLQAYETLTDYETLKVALNQELNDKYTEIARKNHAVAAAIKPACDDFLGQLKTLIGDLASTRDGLGFVITPKHIQISAKPIKAEELAVGASKYSFLKHWETIFDKPVDKPKHFVTSEGDGESILELGP